MTARIAAVEVYHDANFDEESVLQFMIDLSRDPVLQGCSLSSEFIRKRVVLHKNLLRMWSGEYERHFPSEERDMRNPFRITPGLYVESAMQLVDNSRSHDRRLTYFHSLVAKPVVIDCIEAHEAIHPITDSEYIHAYCYLVRLCDVVKPTKFSIFFLLLVSLSISLSRFRKTSIFLAGIFVTNHRNLRVCEQYFKEIIHSRLSLSADDMACSCYRMLT